MHQASCHQLLARGVYRTPYLKNGRRLFVAIDRHGNAVKCVQLLADSEETDVTAWLERWLEHADPIPTLRLVGAEPTPTPAPPPIGPDDPRHPMAIKRYRGQLVRAAVRAMPPRPAH